MVLGGRHPRPRARGLGPASTPLSELSHGISLLLQIVGRGFLVLLSLPVLIGRIDWPLCAWGRWLWDASGGVAKGKRLWRAIPARVDRCGNEVVSRRKTTRAGGGGPITTDDMSRRITLVFDGPPLPSAGAEGRWNCLLLKGLVDRGHAVTAFAPCATREQAMRAAELFPPDRFDLRCYPRPPRRALERFTTLLQPCSAIFPPQLRSDLEEHLRAGTDVLHLEQVWSCWPAFRFADRAILNIHRLHQVDWSESAGVPWALRARRASLLAGERAMLKRVRMVTTFTPLLTARVSQINPLASVRTLPPGLDLPRYPFRQEAAGDRPPTVGLVGWFDQSASYQAAVRLVTRIWPFLKRRVPEARLVLAGACATSRLSRWCADPAISLEETHAAGPDDWGRMDVMVYAPNAASGAKTEVLEAFALGTPVVTTWAGVEGLDALDGTHAGICDYDEGLVERVARLLADSGARRRQAVAAWQLVHSAGNPDRAIRAVEAAHEWLLAEPYRIPASPSQHSLAVAG